MNINGNQVKVIYNGEKINNPVQSEQELNGIDINNNTLFITPINTFNANKDEDKNQTTIESEKAYEITYKDINEDDIKLQAQLINKQYRNIFSIDQTETELEPYMIFQNNQYIEFDELFIEQIEKTYSKNGIFLRCELQVPYNKDDIKLYNTNASFPLCITDIFSHKEFSIVNKDNNKTKINAEDDLQIGLNNYKEAIEDSTLFNKFL